MSLLEIKVPPLAESVANAELTQWHVALNQLVEEGHVIATLETDKTALEVMAPKSGKITKFVEQAGATVLSEQLIAVFEQHEYVAPKEIKEATTNVEVEQQSTSNVQQQSQTNLERTFAPIVNESIQDMVARKVAENSSLGPKARRLIMEHGVDSVEVEKYVSLKLPPHAIAKDLLQRATQGDSVAKTTRIPMTKIRKRIAERLLESKNNTAMLTTFNEVDLSAIVDIRKKYGEEFQKRHNIRLGFMSFFVKAVSEAMKEYPIIGACIDGNDIIYYNTTDISIAVSTERGLVTPVLRSTENMSLAQIERQIANYAKLANDNKLKIEDLTGGNFTITNGGVFGSLFSTPIINPPQSAILGMHGIVKRPVVVNDQVVICPMMYIALSYDHRLIDGRDSVRFLVKVRDLLQNPERLLLAI